MYSSSLKLVVCGLAATAMAAPPSNAYKYNAPTEARASSCQTQTISYTVVSGDTLSALATKFQSGICNIAQANGISDPNLIFVGEKLQIPVICDASKVDNNSCITPPATATCVTGTPNSYIIMSGDTLTTIANNFNITLASLEAANKQNVPNPDVISVGELLHIPVCPNTLCRVKVYNIKGGDTYAKLASKWSTTVGQILAFNPYVDASKLAVGQEINLPTHCGQA